MERSPQVSNSKELEACVPRMGGLEPRTVAVNSPNTELPILSNHVASMHSIAMSYGVPMSDRDVLDLMSSIGQISFLCLSFPSCHRPQTSVGQQFDWDHQSAVFSLRSSGRNKQVVRHHCAPPYAPRGGNVKRSGQSNAAASFYHIPRFLR
ncbi:hypothetical protein BSKO_01795 [Bryopsis sp. KO-2023]|nr:hypothetical protein BSKO_01795 [Bryopsis sp. KO-2023]